MFDHLFYLLFDSQELQRFVGTKFLEWDLQMYDERNNQPAKANTSDLNEDLGQIEYLFCDKTGTLTENEMVFKECSIDGILYQERSNKLFMLNANQTANFNVSYKYNNDDKIKSNQHTNMQIK
jgi:phospholipid-translocating ATPase